MNDTVILAIDCAAGACSVAVARSHDADDVVPLARHQAIMARGHAAVLAPMIDAALTDAGVRPDALGLIAATVGPGSFTGLRIGLATARALALALDVPLAGLTTIEVLLGGVNATERQLAATGGRRLMAAIDTHRGDYFVGLQDAPAPFIADAASLAARLGGAAWLVVGDAAAALCRMLADRGLDAAPADAPPTPDPLILARLAAQRGVAYWRDTAARQGMPRPLYLRPAEVTTAGSRR